MSRVVDDRVVQMQFDNAQFERNVRTSMSTIDNLKKSLNFDGATKGLENINSAAKNVNMSGLGNDVQTVNTRFSALQVIGVTALANITNSVVNLGKQIVHSLTLEPITSGLREYETQIKSVQTILANTQSKGTTIDDVNKALDELNEYADKTIYNFGEMTRNIGTFTAAGVDLEKSVTSIKGISNLAAMSGSSAMQASTAMYQLSQAIAAGKVQLMDWNSVVNAGMGGEVFQNALKRTAEHFGYNVDAMIAKYGSFRESLTRGNWLTAEVLTETLTQLSGAYSEADLIAQGYTEQQAKEIVELAKTATSAATEVKTFSGLIDTTKEALGSGWAQTWEIIIGDYEEAKELFTGISNVLGDMINKSAESRNKLMQGWKDLGGRDELIKSFKNIFEGLASVIKPITEAFREIFPPKTAEQLYKLTSGFEEFTSKLKISDKTAENLKRTFKGLFSILNIITEVISAVAGGVVSLLECLLDVDGGILAVTGTIGDWISNLANAITESNIFGKAIEGIADIITTLISKISGLGNIIGEVFSAIGGGLSGFINNVDFEKTFDIINGGIFASILLGIRKFVNGFTNPFEEMGGVLENVTGILTDVRECFQAYQDQLKAGTLMKIATAIGILATSLLLISTIEPASLVTSLGGLTALFAMLTGTLAILTKMSLDVTGVMKTTTLMIGMSVAVTLLATALKKLSSVDTAGIIKGLIGVGALMIEISLFLNSVNIEGKITGVSFGLIMFSTAMVILSEAVEKFGGLKWSELAKGLLAVSALLAQMIIFTRFTGNSKNVISTAVSMVLLGSAIKTLASAMKNLGSMNLSEIGKSLLLLGGALAEIAIGMRIMPKNMALTGASLLVVSTAMGVLASAMKEFGSMNIKEVGKSLLVLGGALAELSIGLRLMIGTASGSAALLISSAALSLLAPVLKTLSSISWSGIARGLIMLAGSFTIIGVAGMLLTPLIPTLLGLAGVFLLLGAASVGIGAGLALVGVGLAAIAVGFGTLAEAGASGARSVVEALKVIIDGVGNLIPSIAEKFGEAIVSFSKIIGEYSPIIVEAFMKLILEVLKSLATYAPQIVDTLMQFLIGVINALGERLPELIVAVVNLFAKLFDGVIKALKNVNIETIIKGSLAIGLLSGMMAALSIVAKLIPQAMIGVLGIGAVVAELGLVLAAIGALSQIPGLKWLINESGYFLETIGNAIGKFIGGIAGGVMSGVSNSLPEIATNLSEFMTNIKPFIDGAKTIDSSVTEGVTSLAKMMLTITGANILNSITSFITGGNSLEKFAKQLVPFGKAMKEYSDAVSGIDSKSVSASATAGKALSELANGLPNSGGLVGLFVGENNLGSFAKQLIPFGKGMKEYSSAVKGIDSGAITSSATAAKSLSELANNLPNSGGLISLFTGENDLSIFAKQLSPFGKAMKEYSDAISGMSPEAVTASNSAAKSLAELSNNLPNSEGLVSIFTGDNSLASFGSQLIPFGKAMKGYSDAVLGINAESVTASANAAASLSELANNLPNSGGLISLFTGDNSLIYFSSQLPIFGENLKKFSDSISGINAEAMTSASTAAKSLAEMSSYIPNQGGIVAWFTGENSISSFAFQLPILGAGLKGFSDSISGINAEAMTAASTAAKNLAEMTSYIPTEGGIKAWFTGETSVISFAYQLPILGAGLKGFSDSISGINAEAMTAASTAAKNLAEMTSFIPTEGGIKAWFTGETSIASFADKLPTLGEGLKGFSDSVAGINAENLIAASGAAKNLAEMTSYIPTEGGIKAWFTGETSMTSFADKLPTLGEGLKGFSDSVAGINNENVMAASTAANSIANLLKSMEGIKVKGVDNFVTSIHKLAEVDMQAVIDAFEGAASASKLVSVGVSMIKSIGSGMKKTESNLKSTAKNIASATVKTISSQSKEFKSAGSKLISEFASGIKSKKDKAKDEGKAIANSAADGAGSKSAVNSMKSAGYDLGNGLVSGINSKKRAAWNAGYALGREAVKGEKAGQNSHSPSKDTIKAGRWLGEGLIIGIHKMASAVNKAGRNIGETSVRSISKAITKVNSIIDSDMDIRPVVSPVVDLSDVESGVGAINGMFGGTFGIGARANINAISTSMNRRNQNGVNDDVISAIKDLKKTIGENTGDTYQINGITYDDGSNISNAVKTLVRAAKVERRI